MKLKVEMASVKKFARQQFRSLTEHLENYPAKKDPELLHKIRVDIKRIKAILQLTNDQVKGFKGHRNFIPFRTIFRRAGEIREPEVLSELLLEYNTPGTHDSSIERRSEKLIAGFSNDVPSFISTVNKQWLKLNAAFEKVKKKDLRRYLKKVNKTIKSKLYPTPSMDLIHKVRKSIKGVIYLSEVNHRPKKKFRKFYSEEIEMIGELHDRQVLLDVLKKSNGIADKTMIKKIEQECNAKKDKIKKKALQFYSD